MEWDSELTAAATDFVTAFRRLQDAIVRKQDRPANAVPVTMRDKSWKKGAWEVVIRDLHVKVGETFTKRKLFENCSHIFKAHPNHMNPDSGLQVVLSHLRGDGYIEFLGNGVYRRLK